MKQPQLGRRIAELRQSRGLTQEELVEQCNINVRTIQRIEAGEVTPRNYTIKAIFDVLGSAWDELDSSAESNLQSFNKRWLLIALVSSIIYLFTGVPEAVMDYSRMAGDILGANMYEVGSSVRVTNLYMIVKISAALSLVAYISAFFHVGDKLELPILKGGVITLGLFRLLFAAFDVISLWIDSLDFGSPTVMVVYIMIMGIGSGLYGFGLYFLRQTQGALAAVAGVLEILIALCLFTFIFSFLAIFLSIPALILETVLLYRLYANQAQS